MVVVGEELFLKITMCDTNEKFEAILDKYLVDIINDISKVLSLYKGSINISLQKLYDKKKHSRSFLT